MVTKCKQKILCFKEDTVGGRYCMSGQGILHINYFDLVCQFVGAVLMFHLGTGNK